MFVNPKTKAALGKLFRAFNRKVTEDSMENYLEFTQGFPYMVVKAAIEQEIAAADKMPTPARIQSNCKAHNPADEFICTDCNGKGYRFIQPRYDDFGFGFIKPDHATKCPCVTALAPNHPPIIDGPQRKLYAMARLLARSIALRAQTDIDSWRSKFWSSDTRNRWVKAAELIPSMNILVDISVHIEKADPKQCAEHPFKTAAKIMEKVNGKTVRGQRKTMGTKGSFFNI